MIRNLLGQHPFTRRQFLRTTITTSALALGWNAPAQGPSGQRSPNEKLNLAVIGVGGRGADNLKEVSSENIVALCDVNERNLDTAAQSYPKARKYFDFRKLYDDSKDIDAVVVSTPNHTHAFAVLPALKLKKHVYCEKPLAHTVWEARLLACEAYEAKVATQMGTQAHANGDCRRVVECIQTGAVGPVREVHVWASRVWGDGDRPKETVPVPDYLHWDLWLGPAPERPYHPNYINERPGWYKYWDFGGGTLPDLGSHWIDLAFWALNLRHPLAVEAHGPTANPETAPASFHVTYDYGARDQMPPVKLTWYQGEDKPQPWIDGTITRMGEGVLFIGDRGMLLATLHRHKFLPAERFENFKLPTPYIPLSIGHYKEWIKACKTGDPTTCNFNYSGALTEANHLGNVAYRSGRKIEWDPVKLEAKNCPEAARYIHPEYRKGWELKY